MAFITPFTLPRTGLSHSSTSLCAKPAQTHRVVTGPVTIEAAKHVQFKAAKKAERYRPRKHRPSDITRKPPPYPVDALRVEGLPDVMEVIPAGEVDKAFEGKTVIASIESVKAEEEAEAAKMAEAEIQETLAEEDAAEEVSTGEAPVAEA